jgi:hypothetical protein
MGQFLCDGPREYNSDAGSAFRRVDALRCKIVRRAAMPQPAGTRERVLY